MPSTRGEVLSNESAQRVVVIGSTGKIGKEVVRRLAAKGVAVRALVHEPEKAKGMEQIGVAIAYGDLGRSGKRRRFKPPPGRGSAA